MLLVVTGIAATGTGTSGNTPIALEAYGLHQRDVLGVETDPRRGRVWVLGLDSLRVYDAATKKPIREVELPSWYLADAACMPDLVLDSSGSALVSSNVVPQLWRVDAETFETAVIDITLRSREQWDVGFGALRFTSTGGLEAVTSNANSMWSIDLAKGRADLIEIYPRPSNACNVRTGAARGGALDRPALRGGY